MRDIIARDPLTGDIWKGVDFARSSEVWLDSSGHRLRSRREFLEGLLVSAEVKRRRKVKEGKKGWVVAEAGGYG